MGIFRTTVSASSFYVIKKDTIDTECATSYTYDIKANNGDNIDINITTNYMVDWYVYNGVTVFSNNAINCYYLSNGVRTDFNNTTSVTFDTSLVLHFALENSGKPGFYNNLTLTIEDTTLLNSAIYTDLVTRENDSPKCDRDCDIIQNDYGLYPPQLFNPDAGEVISGTKIMTLLYTTDVAIVSINGQVLDDSEYSFSINSLTLTPDNGYDFPDDEILVFQNKM